MNILQLVKDLLPNFERMRIVTDAAVTKEHMTLVVIPSYTEAAATFKSTDKFASTYLNKFNNSFKQTNPNQRRAGAVVGILNIMNNVLPKLAAVEALIPDIFAKDVAKEAITYRKANVLQFLSAVRFVGDYSTRFLLQALALEAAAENGNEAMAWKRLSKRELREFEEQQQAFFQTLASLENLPKDIAKVIMAIPDIEADASKDLEVKALVGAQKLDPLRLNFVPPSWNLIYAVRLRITEWQVRRHKARIAERTSLELRIIDLKQTYAKNQDPKIKQLIEYNEARLQRLNAEIAEAEEGGA